jgi:hypothetical protein
VLTYHLGLLKRNPYLAIAVIGFLVVIIWYLFSDAPRAPVGAACKSNDACQSSICLPDADPKEVARFKEIAQAYELGRKANPGLAGQMDELLKKKLPHSSLTLRRIYPGVCTERCTSDPDCPQDMFCAEAVWVSAIKGIDRGQVRVCMPNEHPAARLMR